MGVQENKKHQKLKKMQGWYAKKYGKQGGDDIKVKVNIQSPIPASFPH